MKDRLRLLFRAPLRIPIGGPRESTTPIGPKWICFGARLATLAQSRPRMHPRAVVVKNDAFQAWSLCRGRAAAWVRTFRRSGVRGRSTPTGGSG